MDESSMRNLTECCSWTGHRVFTNLGSLKCDSCHRNVHAKLSVSVPIDVGRCDVKCAH